MGRRGLKKIDPSLDLSSHLWPLDKLPQPWDATALFARPERDLELEIGSGKGLFLANAAKAVPERNFLGCELAARYARFAAARLARAELENAVLIQGDAQRLVREWLPDNALAALHIYFPDPWWKKRHHKRRLMSESFVPQLARVLRAGGSLHFWTDVQEYFEQTLELLAAFPQLDGPYPVEEATASHDLDYRTHFERRMRLHGEPVYRTRLTKTSHST